MSAQEHKIVITGTMGVGKTTAIRQISDHPPLLTDVANTRRDESNKDTTTAAFDFGELDLGEGEVLRIYGTPGQERFDFMWPIIARGALGIVFLLDLSRADPVADLERYLGAFGSAVGQVPSVLALNKLDAVDTAPVPLFQQYLEARGLNWPIVPTDVRERERVLDLMEILLSLNEAAAEEES